MKSVSIIIPCYNEEEGLPQLFDKLIELQSKLASLYNYSFIFVDDGSRDKTYPILTSNIPRLNNAKVIKHEVNSNLGAALKTGLSHISSCDYVTFLDSDCTYEPQIVLRLLSKLEEGFDVVTVSPYHPEGGVEGVPAWRLVLSKGASLIYRLLLGTNFYTYTAMVRAGKTSFVLKSLSSRNDFTFVVESFIKSIQNNARVAEIPTVLKVRRFGTSKMNIVKTIIAHLTIIRQLLIKGKL